MLHLFETLATNLSKLICAMSLRCSYPPPLAQARREHARCGGHRAFDGLLSRNETQYQLPAIVPDDARVQTIQAELGKLLS